MFLFKFFSFPRVGAKSDRYDKAELAPPPETDFGSAGSGNFHLGHSRQFSTMSGLSLSYSVASKVMVQDRLKGFALWRTQMWALLAKRILYLSRRWILFLAMVSIGFERGQ